MGDERGYRQGDGNQEQHIDSNLDVAQTDGDSDAEYIGEDAECMKEWGVTIEQEVSLLPFHQPNLSVKLIIVLT
jgi:hypothetical protein